MTIVAALCACASGGVGAQDAIDVSRGIEALTRRDIAGAKRAFTRAAADAHPAIRSAGEQWLGHVSWKVDRNAQTAARHLDRALAQASDGSMVLVERARLEGFRRRYRSAVRIAYDAMTRSVDAERRGIAARTVITLAVDGAFAAPLSSSADSVDLFIVGRTRDTLEARVARFPGRAVDAHALLQAGILLQDPQAIERGWLSYFQLVDESSGRALTEARDAILLGVGVMKTDPTNQLGKLTLALGLERSRQFESTALHMRVFRHPRSETGVAIRDGAAYGEFLRGLRTAADDFYAAALGGRAREGDLDRAVNARTRVLWSQLSWSSARPPYYPAAVPRELARRFGTVMSVDRDASIPELHVAHAIASFSVPAIGQARRRATQVVLDGLASGGVDAWLLDGVGGRAGWAASDSIFALRTAFTEMPFRAWVALADPQTMPGELVRIHRDSVADVARASRDSLGYFPGVAARLFRAGAMAILDSLDAAGIGQHDRQRAFVDLLFRQLFHSTITLHESRHVADARLTGRRTSAETEFRAKIDEVTGSARPKLALTAILTATIGAPSAHGQANRRIMVGLARWIRANGGSIPGYDETAPALLQLPLLSDAQLIAAFESLRSAA